MIETSIIINEHVQIQGWKSPLQKLRDERVNPMMVNTVSFYQHGGLSFLRLNDGSLSLIRFRRLTSDSMSVVGPIVVLFVGFVWKNMRPRNKHYKH